MVDTSRLSLHGDAANPPPIAPPALPPGMKPDPNSRDIVTLYSRFCSDCHGDNGGGKISGAPNFIDYPQGLNNADAPMIEKVFEGHGGAPPAKEELKQRTVFHLIDFMRARVGMARAVRAVADYNKQQMVPKSLQEDGKAASQGTATK